MHKLHAPEPLRYSEDLDYVRSTGGGIRGLTWAVTRIGDRLGMEVRTLACVAEELALHIIIEETEALLKVRGEETDFGDVRS
ncbi:MAG: hypothetical protein GWP04_11165 [Gammaproteobacteria bacterium]|nr:hypothetical protein [Gammaproteobacteria bacterium]